MIAFIEKHREDFGVEPICRVLQIAPATFHRHAATARNPELASDRARQDAVDLEKIKVAHGKYRGDGGIDGAFYYLTANDDRSRGIVSVKGGRSLNPGMVRDLGGTVQTQRRLTKDDKAIGVLVCAHEPTRGMRDAAREFGKVDTLFGPVPAVQIITVAEMFAGAVINVPTMLDTVTAAAIGRKRATNSAFKNPRDLAQREMLLAIAGGKAQELTSGLPEDVPVMPSFRERRAAG